MYTIEIKHETKTKKQMIAVLEVIKTQIDAGFTSGKYPAWELKLNNRKIDS